MLVFVFVYITLCPFYSFSIILRIRQAGYFAFIGLCLVTINVLWLFLTLPLVGL